MVGTKTTQASDNNSSLKKVNSIGRNGQNKNIEKTFSGDNLYHKKKINDAIDIYNVNNNINNNNKNIPSGQSSIGHKMKSNISKGGNQDGTTTSPQNKEKLIRISEFKMEPIGPNNNDNKHSLNNSKDLINRLKNQALSLKTSITNKNPINNTNSNNTNNTNNTNNNNLNKNKVISCFQFDDKENVSINKHIQNELSHCHLAKGINILNKDETFEIEHKKYNNGDKNKFNKNSCFFNDKNNNSNNLSKKNFNNNKDYELLKKIKNLKTFHPTKISENKKTISIKVNKDIIDNNKNINVNTLNTVETNNNIKENKNENSLNNKNKNLSKTNHMNKSKDKLKLRERNNSQFLNKEKKTDKSEKENRNKNKYSKINSEENIDNQKNKNKEELILNNININININEQKENNKIIKKEKNENKEKIEKEIKDKNEIKESKEKYEKKENNLKNKEEKVLEEKEKEKENIKNIEKEDNLSKNKTTIKEKEKNLEKIKENTINNKLSPLKNEIKIEQEEKVIYFDTSNINNVQIPKDYLNIIYYNLLVEENKELVPKPVHTYMKNQKEINDQMRSILVDWIIDVHHKFGFTDETLFMTILIIDRYCSIEQVTRIKYQCLGITALMIACKHEEINVPKVEDFIYITDNAYTKDEVFQMENDVLSKLHFSLLYPSPIKFYEYLSLHFNFSKKYHMLGKYLMESFLLDLKYIKYKPSIISCACTYIVMKFFKMSNYRQSYDKKFYLVNENINTISSGLGVKDCAQDICVYVDNINNTNLLSCQKKYTKPEFESVSTLISNNNK